MRLSNVVCPFCFEKFHLSKVHFRCENTNNDECPKENDVLLAKYLQKSQRSENRSIILPNLSFWKRMFYFLFPLKKISCDKCSKITKLRLCPHCHNTLPLIWGEAKEHIIAVIGGRDTGKSHFIASLVSILKDKVSHDFEAMLISENDETAKRYRKDFYGPLFEEKTLLPATQPSDVDVSVKCPMIFRLSFDKRKSSFFSIEKKFFKPIKNIHLVFFDTAGENLAESSKMKVQNKYIFQASGIIFLLDPLQIKNVRKKIEKSSSPSVNIPPLHLDTAPEDLVDRLIHLFESEKGLRAEEQIKTPTAFCFSKIDELKEHGLLPLKDLVYGSNSHLGYFNEANADAVHLEIQKLAKEWMGLGFTQKLDIRFEKYQFFGISSLGRPPSGEGKIENPQPFRVEDPFLWLLAVLKAIPVKNNNEKLQ